MARPLLAIIPALWVATIAIVAVQNATPVSIRLLTLQSIDIPFGVLLAFGVAGGMVAAAVGLALLRLAPAKRKPQR
ncbi:hypothetical protein [Phormidium sp. FACHB-1136]|jgi:uncharacterized integral membrane protein|uniref:hypothetical protein n=1 Tax=Phormidium sp. FACHB-1136 TaxID=2692848 RepID=UPI001681FC61|nr:hypothetical protein [Phormidium sp. FACHB-1136]MBD2428990.1 hypothetical protein [Phormidium sp. FACHB-1136]